jgi:hypothetical protein
MRLFARAFVSLVGMTLTVGCQQIEDPPPAFTFDPLQGYSTPEDSVLLEGARLCLMDTDTCELSNSRGEVTIEIPIGESWVTLTKDGYLPYLFPFVMGPAGRSGPFGVESNQFAKEQYDRVGSPYPMDSQGAVFLSVGPRGVVGATFDLLGAAAGVEQFYLDDEGLWDPNAEATASFDGWGGFTEVNPDVLQAKVGGMVSGCKLIYGWPGDTEDTVRFPVREGYATWVRWSCNQDPL